MTEPSLDRIHLELTNRCNFRCEFCPQDTLLRPARDMDFGLFERLVEEIARERLAPAVAYHVLGEPLLYRRLPEAVAVTRRAGLRSVLITNGSLLGGERVEDLAAAGPDFVGVSLQTPDAASFALRGAGDMGFEEFRAVILDGLRTLMTRSPGTRVSIYLLTTPLKWALFPATRGLSILDTSRALRATVVDWLRDLSETLGPDHPLSSRESLRRRIGGLRVWRQNRLDLSERLTIETRIAGDWGRRARVRPRRSYPARLGTCHGLADHAAVLSDGTYAYCCTDHEGRTSGVNASAMGLREFLGSPAVLRDREGFRSCRVHNPVCQECLGGPSRLHRTVRQWGSIFYRTVYRRWFQDPMGYREP